MKRWLALCLGFALVAVVALAGEDGGQGKRLFEEKCVLCHGLERTLALKMDRAGWEKVVKRMRNYGSGLISEEEAATILDHLAATQSP